MTVQNMTQQSKPLNVIQWWVCFGLATYILSQCFAQFRIFTLTPNWATGGTWLGMIALLLGLMLLLGYDTYIHEKRGGKVRNPIRFFDWLDARGFLTGGHAND